MKRKEYRRFMVIQNGGPKMLGMMTTTGKPATRKLQEARIFWVLLFAVFQPVFSEELKFTEEAGIRWYDATGIGLEGRGFQDVKSPFDRLPARAEGVVRDAVWSLSRHSAGMAVRFVTRAERLHARWSLTSSRLEMPHMPATGVSGIDLYSKNDRGEWRWLTVGQPKEQSNNIELIAGLPGDVREFLLYLPLYNGLSELKIGVPAGESIEVAPGYPATQAKPLVFYGTSITHGACASRPGMCHPSILGRWYHRPVINLGFSGNGMMEPEVGQFLTEIDAAAYIIDCLPNMTAEQVAERTRPLVEQLRAARPETPIVLVEDRDYSNGWLIEGPRNRNRSSQSALKRAHDELVASGVERLYYIEGPDLLGDDSEGTVDNSHPNDLGFMRQAEGMDKVLGPLFR